MKASAKEFLTNRKGDIEGGGEGGFTGSRGRDRETEMERRKTERRVLFREG